MKIESDDIEAAALELWTEVFRAQCSLPRGGEPAFSHVNAAESTANYAEKAFRDRLAKETSDAT